MKRVEHAWDTRVKCESLKHQLRVVALAPLTSPCEKQFQMKKKKCLQAIGENKELPLTLQIILILLASWYYTLQMWIFLNDMFIYIF